MKSAPPVIMVVDDDPIVRDNLKAFMEDEGFMVLTAASAEETLQELRQHACDVLVVDIRLPGMDGHKLIQEVTGRFPAVRFLIHTGLCHYELPQPLQSLGVRPEHVFHKPVADMTLISRAVRCLCAKE